MPAGGPSRLDLSKGACVQACTPCRRPPFLRPKGPAVHPARAIGPGIDRNEKWKGLKGRPFGSDTTLVRRRTVGPLGREILSMASPGPMALAERTDSPSGRRANAVGIRDREVPTGTAEKWPTISRVGLRSQTPGKQSRQGRKSFPAKTRQKGGLCCFLGPLTPAAVARWV